MKTKTSVPFSIKKKYYFFFIIFFIPFYACENIDDTIPADGTITTRSYGQYTDEQWKIVKLMPNIESIKWKAPAFKEDPPNLIMEVKPAQACGGFMSNGYKCYIEVGVSNYFNPDDLLLEYIPCFQRELYSSEVSYVDQTTILTIPATELGEGNYIAVRSIFTKKGEPYYGEIKTEKVQSLWNPYATMMEFDKRFPRPAYNDNLPMHISIAVEFEASSEDQYCEFYIGTNSTPVASASCEANEYPITKYATFDCYNSNNIELAYRVRNSHVTVFYTIPYKTNIISLTFRAPVIHLYQH